MEYVEMQVMLEFGNFETGTHGSKKDARRKMHFAGHDGFTLWVKE